MFPEPSRPGTSRSSRRLHLLLQLNADFRDETSSSRHYLNTYFVFMVVTCIVSTFHRNPYLLYPGCKICVCAFVSLSSNVVVAIVLMISVRKPVLILLLNVYSRHIQG